MNYDGKRFRPTQQSANSETKEDTIFYYVQRGNILTASYQGGGIVQGQLIGLVDAAGNIDMRYQQVNLAGELMTGTCQSTPELLPNGKLRLHEQWQWTSGDCTAGSSVLEEF